MSALMYSGVKITIEQCEHCGATPSEEQIKKSIEFCRRELKGRVCSVCGENENLVAATLYHYKEAGQDRWGSRVTEGEFMLLLSGINGFTHQVRLHPKCAMQAMPHVKWGFSL